LFIYNIASGELVTPSALNMASLEEMPPQFLPGGKEIACGVKMYEEVRNPMDFRRLLIAYDVDKGTYRTIAEFDRKERIGVPIAGPDGKYIYFDFSSSEWTYPHREVHRVPIDGGKHEMVFGEDYVLYIVDFIPAEGKALMSYHIQEFNRRYVCIGDLETGKTKLITGDGEDIELFMNTGLKHLSPDGILFLTHYHDLTYDYHDVLVMDSEGGSRINISNTALFNEGWAAWIVLPEGIEIPEGGYEL
jgi:hypothetical protein